MIGSLLLAEVSTLQGTFAQVAAHVVLAYRVIAPDQARPLLVVFMYMLIEGQDPHVPFPPPPLTVLGRSVASMKTSLSPVPVPVSRTIRPSPLSLVILVGVDQAV